MHYLWALFGQYMTLERFVSLDVGWGRRQWRARRCRPGWTLFTPEDDPQGPNVKSQQARGSETLPNKVLLRSSGRGAARLGRHTWDQREALWAETATLRRREGQNELVCLLGIKQQCAYTKASLFWKPEKVGKETRRRSLISVLQPGNDKDPDDCQTCFFFFFLQYSAYC